MLKDFLSPTYHLENPEHPTDPRTPVLLAGLGVSETDLLLWFRLLRTHIPLDVDGDVVLDRDSISLLYRHARLARAIKWGADDFIQALRLLFPPEDATLTGVDRILTVLEFREWLRTAPFTVSDLRFVLKGEEGGSAKCEITPETVATLVQQVQSAQGEFLVGDVVDLTSFATKLDQPQDGVSVFLRRQFAPATRQLLADYIGGASEAQPLEQALVEELNRIVKGHSSIYNAETFAEVILSSQTEELCGRNPHDEALVRLNRLLLEDAYPQELLRLSTTRLKAILARTFNLTANHLENTLLWVKTDINSAGIEIALNPIDNEPDHSPDLTPLITMTQEMERVLAISNKFRFKEETVAYLTGNPAALGIVELKNLQFDDLKALAFYRDMVAPGGEAEPHVQAVLNQAPVLVNHEALPDGVAHLADLWQQDRSLIESLVNALTLPAVPIQGLKYLWECLTLCRTLGVNGYSLQKLAIDDAYSALEAARDVALGAFSVKYNEDPFRRDKLEPYQDKINVMKRDALCDYIIARERELKFKDLSDIYAYFLLDVEMSGCFRTSRVVCATSSLQLYVHRVLVNLEQSVSGAFVVLEQIPRGEIPHIKQEWEWRKNYRVWEANRKVFLYPENYLEPDLRDNKSPIFRELEDELLQEKVTKEAAEAAYKKYVTQFAELARLCIAGSYYHEDTNTYYFFGRTAQDPPQYYYRRWKDSMEWTPWEKIDLAINAPYVTAIVHLGKLYLFWISSTKKERVEIEDGTSKTADHIYTILIEYSFQNEASRWITPQRLQLEEIDDSEVDAESLEFRLSPFAFPDLYGGKIHISYHYDFQPTHDHNTQWKNICGELDLFNNRLVLLPNDGMVPEAMKMSPSVWLLFIDREYDPLAFVRIERERFPFGIIEAELSISITNKIMSSSGQPVTTSFDPHAGFDMNFVGQRHGEFIFIIGNQQYLIKRLFSKAYLGETPEGLTVVNITESGHGFIRLSTSLVDELGRILFDEGVEKFLALETQQNREAGLPLTILPEFFFGYLLPSNPDHIDFTGSYGAYYREIFFHIPFLIANHLNANQKFEEAKWWYERIFDPTAIDPPDEQNADEPNPNDRNWRYIEFRGGTIETMREILTDKDAITKYKEDPFNPHAIARERFGAYQTAIVMKYIDNLLDWGDYLFAQDTMESINEAKMLYVMAADILGKRPVSLGKCNTGLDERLTYPEAKDAIEREGGSEFLLILENQSFADEAGVPWQRKGGPENRRLAQAAG